MTVWVYEGALEALSDFRKFRMAQQLAQHYDISLEALIPLPTKDSKTDDPSNLNDCPGTDSAVFPGLGSCFQTHYIHFVKSTSEATECSANTNFLLQSLFQYAHRTSDVNDEHCECSEGMESENDDDPNLVGCYLVVPRLGTISPWSSKATDIAKICCLDSIVERIERGLCYKLHFRSVGDRRRFELSMRTETVLHDRMTQDIELVSDPSDILRVGTSVLSSHLGSSETKSSSISNLRMVDLGYEPLKSLELANESWGLSLSKDDMIYLAHAFGSTGLNRSPTDTELMMFSQVNSEHCRHKIFNAKWFINGEPQPYSLFDMIRKTYATNPNGILSAYKDNAAVFEGGNVERFFSDAYEHKYCMHTEPVHTLIKVETHNHPTAVSPFSGSATGSGGEIRDEGAVGQGSKPKASCCGFSVSNLNIPGFIQPWEQGEEAEETVGKPVSVASALQIMLEAPLGAAAYNNEFGRPNLCGYFRTFLQAIPVTSSKNKHSAPSQVKLYRGYHKPIMIAGGLGNIRDMHIKKRQLKGGDQVLVIGGPSMLIGLGGGAASSRTSGTFAIDLDFASVQRENPEMERRCQEVIDTCWSLGSDNPIQSIHDVGAGGLSNALPELVHDSGKGLRCDLNHVPSADSNMSAMELWCNESQERYVIAATPENIPLLEKIAQRERCPYAIVGTVLDKPQLVVDDTRQTTLEAYGYETTHLVRPVNMDMSLLFGNAPKMTRQTVRPASSNTEEQLPGDPPSYPANLFLDWHTPLSDEKRALLGEMMNRVLHFPAVASKSFLITIGDRSITGLVARDQMVGLWQCPVADVAVTAAGYSTMIGEAMAMGERAPLSLFNAPASGRMAVAEAVTNIAAAFIDDITSIRLSANWMAAADFNEDDRELFETVQAVGLEFCASLGVAIPVGKDSLSMRTTWKDEANSGIVKSVASPISLIVTAFAPVKDIRLTNTPVLQELKVSTSLYLVDLCSPPKLRLGGSVLTQVFHNDPRLCFENELVPDITEPKRLAHFFHLIQTLRKKDLLLAYHDRSDGGLFVTLCEMAFASHLGFDVNLENCGPGDNFDIVRKLFSEELGAVIQLRDKDESTVFQVLKELDWPMDRFLKLGPVTSSEDIVFRWQDQIIYQEKRFKLHQTWMETSYQMEKLRDHPHCADEAWNQLVDVHEDSKRNSGLETLRTRTKGELIFELNFDPIAIHHLLRKPLEINYRVSQNRLRPRVAILREQGCNGHIEMAYAFYRAGFDCVDVHMSDIIGKVNQGLIGTTKLDEFVGLAVCGGFSYGDVLGAGQGWARSILLHPNVREQFRRFFSRPDTFTLGICNGCQMLAHLKELIPGANHWPRFIRNRSERFEARVCSVKIDPKSPSILLRGMGGSILPIAVAHGEGRAEFDGKHDLQNFLLGSDPTLTTLCYVDHNGRATTEYPSNPNGSPCGLAGITSRDGRVTLFMPHPERMVRSVCNTWYPYSYGTSQAERGCDTFPSLDMETDIAPWQALFDNARLWVEEYYSSH